jgi:hypothetical protein
MGKKTSKQGSKPKVKAKTPAPKAAKGKQIVRKPAAAPITAEPAAAAASAAEEPKRKLGVRGAAPWAARHAAKHAAEARARAAVPPPPGSARATIRVPSGAEEIKAKISDLHGAINEIRVLRKNLPQNFFEVGLVLRDIRARKLYEARGFGTFEGFLDRELDLGKITSLRLVRISEAFHREIALEYGMDRLLYVMTILEAPDKPVALTAPSNQQPKTPLPMHPPGTTAKK